MGRHALVVAERGRRGRNAPGAEQHLRDQQRRADERQALQLVLRGHQALCVQQQRLGAVRARVDRA